MAGLAASRCARLGCFGFWLVEAVEGGHAWSVAYVASSGMKRRWQHHKVVRSDCILWLCVLTGCVAASSLAGRPDGMTATQRHGCGGVRPAVADVARTASAFRPPHVLWWQCGWQCGWLVGRVGDDAGWVAAVSGRLRRVKLRVARLLWVLVGRSRRRWRTWFVAYMASCGMKRRRQHPRVVRSDCFFCCGC